MRRRPPRSTLCPDTTLFRSVHGGPGLRAEGRRALAQLARGEPDRAPFVLRNEEEGVAAARQVGEKTAHHPLRARGGGVDRVVADRKRTRLNSRHANISSAVF